MEKILEPALNIGSINIGMAVAAKTKNPEIGKATGIILKPVSAEFNRYAWQGTPFKSKVNLNQIKFVQKIGWVNWRKWDDEIAF